MLSSLGLEVARQIPLQFIPGLASGAYTLHGGVIRDGLGRIVSHLVTANSVSSGLTSLVPGLGTIGALVNAGQLYSIGQDVAQVQQTVNTVLAVSSASVALSGLGLVTSIAGFAYLNQRLGKMESKLSALEKNVKVVKHLLQSQQKAQLQAAIDDLHQAELTHDDQQRHDLLMHSKSSFSTLAHYYREQWGNGDELLELEGIDELYTLAFTGASLAASELGMEQVARTDYQRHYGDWLAQARQHCGQQTLRDDPERLLDATLVQALSSRELVGMLDFVNGTRRGIDWIDDLREQQKPAGVFERFKGASKSASAQEQGRVAFAKRLQARDGVLNANVAHLDFLAGHKLSASAFAKQAVEALEQSEGQAICISASAVG